MFLAFQMDFMIYGLLLTTVFELYRILMPRAYADRIDYCNVEKIVVPRVPLEEIKPYRSIPVGRTKEEVTHDYMRENEILKIMLKDSNDKFKGLRTKYLEVTAKLDKAKAKRVAEEITYEEVNSEINKMIMEKELIASVVVDNTGSLPEITDFSSEFGVVTAVIP